MQKAVPCSSAAETRRWPGALGGGHPIEVYSALGRALHNAPGWVGRWPCALPRR
jgi:hypothetical protein